MKRLTKAAALLAAGTLLLGALISCTPHGAGGAFDSATDNGGGSGSGSGSGSGEQEEDFDTPTKVDALWDFVNASAVPTGITATLAAGADFTSVATLNNDTTKSGIGASFKFVDGSASKFKTSAEEPTKGAGIYVTGGTDAVNDAGTGYKGKFALTIKYKANVELMVAGNGSNDGRWIVVTNSSGTKVDQKTFTSEANTIVNAEKFDLGELDGGVYYIYALGCRIFRLSALNDVEEVTPVPITGVSVSASSDEIKVGDSTTLTATITPSTTTEDKTVAWSITEGETKVTLSATTGAEITVTGAAAGSATIKATVGSFSATATITVTEDLTIQSGTFELDLSGSPAKDTILTTTELNTISEGMTNVPISDGRTLDNKKYFKIAGNTSTWVINSQQTKVTYINLNKSCGNGVVSNMTDYIEFTVTGTANLSISARSTSSSNTSDIFVYDSEGNAVTATYDTSNENLTESTIKGDTVVTYTYSNLSSGTYKIATAMNTTTTDDTVTLANDRALRIQKLSAVQTVE
ncbi:MAG: Ig-like domain-containing protein [Treponema sp.]|uniref:Ig-like domain-containing protein n=1 Tax=Treponema sp. TaxID=166 RepID=UPI0025F3A8C8|nr:Ig-like domain-containing protein [Treponema sp.]MBQ9282945.1 Ig-like domain-containing protein [Treponema sp.]